MRIPDWLEPDLSPIVRQALDAALPDDIPQRSPAALTTIVARTAHEAYQFGRATALAELRTTAQVAAELSLGTAMVRRLAQTGSIGTEVGGGWRLFTPADVARLRERKTRPGPARRNKIDSGNSSENAPNPIESQ